MCVRGANRALKVEGLDVRVRRLGSGRPVVLVHGLGVSSSYFGPLAEQLAGEMRVVLALV